MVLAVSCGSHSSPSGQQVSSIKLTRVFPGLDVDNPVVLRQHPGDSTRWYVVQQNGIIKTFSGSSGSATVALDISSKVSRRGGEMGLLGFDFHPEFASNNYIYVYYSRLNADQHQSVVSRFTMTSDTVIDTGSETILMVIDQPFDNHNGGNILFGPDGYLYIGTGDGGSAGDPEDHAQDTDSLLGKMLRIDVDSGSPYAIPADNPFVGKPGLDEIYALGLRNPWRWSFDRLNGDLILGDVGQNHYEEVDYIVKGGNYGWRCYEGNSEYNTSGCAASGSYIKPIYVYDHNNGISISGGYVYRGSAISSLYGTYVFSDYGPGPVWGLAAPAGTPAISELTSLTGYISSFAEDGDGELYIISYLDGAIYKIEPGEAK